MVPTGFGSDTAFPEITQGPAEVRVAFDGPRGQGCVRFWGDIPQSPELPVEAGLATMLLPAMATGRALSLPGPLSPRVRRALPEIQAVLAQLAAESPTTHQRLERIAVTASRPARRSGDTRGRGVSAFFSGGVDSLATLLSNPDVTDLIYVHGFDVPIDRPDVSAAVERRLRKIAIRWDKPLRIVRTDMRGLLDAHVSWEIAHGPALAAIALLFAPTCKRVLVASTASYAAPAPRGSHPLHDHLWSTERCSIEHDGAHLTRGKKTMLIAGHVDALEVLRVCWEKVDSYNCCKCEKCLRTMALLEIIGALERCPTFPIPLDLDTIAALSPEPDVRTWWEENLLLARARGADPRLIAAIEACLAPATKSEPAELRDQLAEARAREATLERDLQAVTTSRSWRMTEPLRRAGAAARRLRRRGPT